MRHAFCDPGPSVRSRSGPCSLPAARSPAPWRAMSIPALSGPVIEIGPGTGPVTAALLRRGVAPERLVLLEFSPEFCALLRKRHPAARVIEGDAYQIAKTLAPLGLAPASGRRLEPAVAHAPGRGASRSLAAMFRADGARARLSCNSPTPPWRRYRRQGQGLRCHPVATHLAQCAARSRLGLSSARHVSPRERLIIALDVASVEEAERLVSRIGEAGVFYKIGMELVYAGGLSLVQRLVGESKKVFVDLKLHDIPNTVERATAQIARLGASFLTIHAYPQTMKAALVGAAGSKLKLLGVTVLTSMNDKDLVEAGYASGRRDDRRASCAPGEIARPCRPCPLSPRSPHGARRCRQPPHPRHAGHQAERLGRLGIRSA